MKSLQRLACFAAIALLAMPAFAASGPPDLAIPGPMAMGVTTTAADIASVPAHDMCVLAIVEDVTTCTIALASVSGPCPAIVARVITAMGPAIASPSFVAVCAARPAPPD